MRRVLWIAMMTACSKAAPPAPPPPPPPPAPAIKPPSAPAPADAAVVIDAAPAYPVTTGAAIARVAPDPAKPAVDAGPPWARVPETMDDGYAQRLFDGKITAIAPVSHYGAHDVDASEHVYLVTLDTPAKVTTLRDDDPQPTTTTHGAAILVGVPAGVAIDLAVGQHLQGDLSASVSQWAGTEQADLSDDAGPVLVVDPHSIDDAQHAGVISPDFAPGAPIKRHAVDGADEDRFQLVATVPGAPAKLMLDGWRRQAIGSADYALFGQAVVRSPKSEARDGVPRRVHFAMVRQPKAAP